MILISTISVTLEVTSATVMPAVVTVKAAVSVVFFLVETMEATATAETATVMAAATAATVVAT